MGSNPGLIEGQVPTAAQWNSYFAKKLDDPGYTPLGLGGGTLTGPLFTCASTTATTGFNIAPGVAPTAPNTGDIWATNAGLFVSIAGSTYNLITSGGTVGGTGVIIQRFVGGTLSGNLTLAASTSFISGLNYPPGTGPSSPLNGDIWMTSSDLWAEIGGTAFPISQPARLPNLPTKASPLQTDYLLLYDTVGGALAKVQVSTVGLSNVLRSNTTANLTVGFTYTAYNAGTFSGTYTPAASNGNYQYGNNNGSFTIANPSADSSMDILVTNQGSAGSISFSGFNVSSNTGDSLTTANGSRFIISIRRIGGVSTYLIKALQ